MVIVLWLRGCCSLVNTTLKYSFGNLSAFNDPFQGFLVETNGAVGGLLVYAVLFVVFFVVVYVFMERTQDISKSLLSGVHVLALLSVLLFYAGKLMVYPLVSELFLLSVLIAEALGIGFLLYRRMNET